MFSSILVGYHVLRGVCPCLPSESSLTISHSNFLPCGAQSINSLTYPEPDLQDLPAR